MVSILISVDSGLIQAVKQNGLALEFVFQSLFQWIPVLYSANFSMGFAPLLCFNPYFSGFRSYTYRLVCICQVLHRVSILISVDSGLILLICFLVVLFQYQFQSLFQWIPVLYVYIYVLYGGIYHVSILISVDSGLIQLNVEQLVELKSCFNPYFSGFRSYTLNICRVWKLIFKFQSLFQWIPVLYSSLHHPPNQKNTSFNPYFSGFRSYTYERRCDN